MQRNNHSDWHLLVLKTSHDRIAARNSAHDPSPGLPRLIRICRYLAVSRKPVGSYRFRLNKVRKGWRPAVHASVLLVAWLTVAVRIAPAAGHSILARRSQFHAFAPDQASVSSGLCRVKARSKLWSINSPRIVSEAH
jgi:hypothetical protein